MADTFLLLPAEDRLEALSVAADRSGRQAHLLKKDAWMVWALATLYGSPLGEHLVSKANGTQLSGRLYNHMVTRAPTAKIL
jgi:hypothetical protein